MNPLFFDEEYFRYERASSAEIHYLKCMEVIKPMRCQIHKKRVSVMLDTDFNGSSTVWIEKYCCLDFAEKVVDILEESEGFDAVAIKKF